MAILTPRWTPLKPHPEQIRYILSQARFKTVPAGRRSGKTERGKRKLVIKTLQGTRYPRPRFFAGAPTRQQAKQIFWEDLKALFPREYMRGKPSETDLVIPAKNGAELHVVGLDKPERVEGQPWDGCLIDEIANVKKDAWQLNIRPALSDRNGWADLIGVPEGRNHYYKLDKNAKADTTGLWDSFHWKSADILSPEEIAAAMNDLDELSFKQEYEASFVNFEGRIYYPFDEKQNCAPLKYDPDKELIFCFDFNVSPGVAAIIQEQVLPNGVTGTGVIGEVWIPMHSNTVKVCGKLIQDWGNHKGIISCYGDATGGAKGSAKVEGSDWDLIRREINKHFGEHRVYYEYPKMNPRERVRVNAVNSRIKSSSGIVRLMVDNAKAKHVVEDFEGVAVLEGSAGEIDKDSDKMLTHLTDAIGYYIVERWPITAQSEIKMTGS